ncbi:Ground-like domain-containing protein [Strongyloides ratti]|uniref:Ground-like domain-containing protein n=1 Tax=Strongyloides ratti TaxID=34506 RepID=A0A090LKX4_STRRB|nr:Ground-like domain-containing protein [Strongyloides ratti]CEF68818.1 Ground-like domain-containing protein [Strongyloides ratti]
MWNFINILIGCFLFTYINATKGKLKTELLNNLNLYTNNQEEQLELFTPKMTNDIEKIENNSKKDTFKNQIVSKVFKSKVSEYNEKLLVKKPKYVRNKNGIHKIKQRQLDSTSNSELDEIKRWRHTFYRNLKTNPTLFRPQIRIEKDDSQVNVPVVKEFGRDHKGRTIRLFGVEASGYKFNNTQNPPPQFYDYVQQNNNFPTLSPVVSNRIYQEKYGNEYLSPMKSKTFENDNENFQVNTLPSYNNNPISNYNQQQNQFSILSPGYINNNNKYESNSNQYNPSTISYNVYPNNNNNYYTTTPSSYIEQKNNFFTTIQPYINQQQSIYTISSTPSNYYSIDNYQQQQIVGLNKYTNEIINCPSGTKPSSYNPKMCEQILLTPSMDLSTQPIGIPEVSQEDIINAKPDENIEKCNNPKMQEIIEETIITNDADKSKRAIQERLESEFNGYFNVICGTGFFSYIAHTDDFCQVSGGGLNCYIFSPVCQKIQTSHFYSYPGTKNKKKKYNVIHKGKVYLNRN